MFSKSECPPQKKLFLGGPFHISVWNFCMTSNGNMKWNPPKIGGGHSDLLNMGKFEVRPKNIETFCRSNYSRVD